MSNEVFSDDQEVQQNLPEDLGLQFTEMYIKNPDNISLLLSLLQVKSFECCLFNYIILIVLKSEVLMKSFVF